MTELPRTVKTQQSRTVMVGFLGAIVRELGGWMPIAGVVTLLGQLGLDESSVRSAVFRLKSRGWLEADRRDGISGYVMTDLALASFAEGDVVVWHARQPADLADGWCVVNFSVPESERAVRHQMRARLAATGFGHVGAGVWIAPARMLLAATRICAELGTTKSSAIFVGDYRGGQDLYELVRTGWDLDELNTRYRDFIADYTSDTESLESPAEIDGEYAFSRYVQIIDRWRKLPFRDPGLPVEFLGDSWAAADAGMLFERLVHTLAPVALAHASRFWPPRESAETH